MALVSYEISDSEIELETEQEVPKEKTRKRIKIEAPPIPNTDYEYYKTLKLGKFQVSTSLFGLLPQPKQTNVIQTSSRKFNVEEVKKKNLIPNVIKKGNNVDDKTKNYFFNAPFKPKSNNNIDCTKFSAQIKVDSAKDVEEKPKKEIKLKELKAKLNCVKVVDINSPEFKSEWKRSALKAESAESAKSADTSEEPSYMSRKKHQITYLAYEAKRNEETLKNQWALNKMSRKQTQAKYGF